MVGPAVKTVVPSGANHTWLEAVAELTMVTAVPLVLRTLAAKTVFWFEGGVSSTFSMAVEAVDIFPAASMTNSL
jgi:hypothetical protein